MRVRELQQELLNMDPDMEVMIPNPACFDCSGDEVEYVPVQSWDHIYPDPEEIDLDNNPPTSIVLWPQY